MTGFIWLDRWEKRPVVLGLGVMASGKPQVGVNEDVGEVRHLKTVIVSPAVNAI